MKEALFQEVVLDTDEVRRVAHEVNNALAVIGTLSELLLQARDPDDPECVDIADIQAATERAAAAVRRLEDGLGGGSSRRSDDLEGARLPDGGPRDTLLLVEADPHLRGLLRRFFVPRGFEILDASSWAEATALTERGGLAADLVVSLRCSSAPEEASAFASSAPRLELDPDLVGALDTPEGRAEVVAQLEAKVPRRMREGVV